MVFIIIILYSIIYIYICITMIIKLLDVTHPIHVPVWLWPTLFPLTHTRQPVLQFSGFVSFRPLGGHKWTGAWVGFTAPWSGYCKTRLLKRFYRVRRLRQGRRQTLFPSTSCKSFWLIYIIWNICNHPVPKFVPGTSSTWVIGWHQVQSGT